MEIGTGVARANRINVQACKWHVRKHTDARTLVHREALDVGGVFAPHVIYHNVEAAEQHMQRTGVCCVCSLQFQMLMRLKHFCLPLRCVTGWVPSRMASRACTYNKFNCTGSRESMF